MEEPSNAADVVQSVNVGEDAKVCIDEQPEPSNPVHSPSNATDVLQHSAVDDYATVCIDEQPRPSTAVHSSEKVTVFPTTCEPNSMKEPVEIFKESTAAGDVVITYIGEQKAFADMIDRRKEEENASVSEDFRIFEKDAIEDTRSSASDQDEELKHLKFKYLNKKVLYDKYLRMVNPNCRYNPEKITSVDIRSRKNPVRVIIHRKGDMNFKVHTPLKLSVFSISELVEIEKCVSKKKSRHAKLILDDLGRIWNELTRIKFLLGIVDQDDMTEFNPMIKYEEILKKRKLDERGKEGSAVDGMERISFPYDRCTCSQDKQVEDKLAQDSQCHNRFSARF